MDLLWIPHGHIVAAVWLIWPPALRLIWFDSSPIGMMRCTLISIWLMTCHIDTIHGFLLDSLQKYPLSYRDETTRISYGFFLDFWWTKLILIWPEAVVLIWLDALFRIEMIRIEMMPALVSRWSSPSYWYEHHSRIDMRRERRILYPLLSLNLTVIFLVIWTGMYEGHTADFYSHFHRWNDRSFWARKEALDKTANLRPKTLNLSSFQSDRRFVKKNLLKSI